MSSILIDVGNSYLKFAVWQNEQLGVIRSISYTNTTLLHLLQEHLEPEITDGTAYISNVAGAEVQQTLFQYFTTRKIGCLFAKSMPEFGGLVNAYFNPEQLGVDRWLAIIAVNNCFSLPFCVVDCGTAITIDGVDLKGNHLGGLILPGVASMKSALNSRTASIRLDELESAIGIFGHNTSQAVSNGIVQSIAALIEKALNTLEQECGKKAICVLSGGDAELIKGVLPNLVEVEANLVLKGLAIYFGLSK